ncbi:ribosomal RNA-processing protein 14-C-like [Andrographis paniculata]|uniref:ribosomal RNA-processing protein 14-C-like n=1 Tax=Andrographis paniculata TaxID=175694 RepID=UPI0021E87246|nr:ribosomal RNA-processing protein 14-C-like [Andrographis paniculata]
MKKKKQKQTNNVSTAAAADNDIGGDLGSSIQLHSDFFDHLVELIPSRFYLTNEDDSKTWFAGLSKAAQGYAKHETRKHRKLARRKRFDPDNDPSTLHLLEQQQSSKAPDPEEGELFNLEDDAKHEAKEKSVTYEELREKLHKKIELLRANRIEKTPGGRRARRKDRFKRKRDSESDGGGQSEKEERGDDDGEEIIEYGKVNLGDEDEGKQRKKNKKRKLSKAKELERAKTFQEVKKQNPYVAERASWKAATSRAMGEKVHDDPRLIKESMKREKRKKMKNAEKWKERVESQEKMKEERQRKRKENIDGRIHEKKMRKIAKREKKLMRPGFEGRKQGFITDE